jgi:murein DD-endopeptidase MepM/ murein hydrolase activator NlpD
MFVTLNAFTQTVPANSKTRPEVTPRQLHSSTLSEESGLFADGLKLKMDLSVLEEAEERRETFDPNEIPADDVYEGMWTNRHVNIYGSLKNAPDTFIVDLENFTMPAVGHMTSNFGRRGSRRYHYGIDIKAQTGDTIYAAFDGKIRVKQFERKGYGYYLVVRHLNGLETVYGHLSKFLVEENDFVRSGQPIGLAGNTGRSFGSHLHFETRFLGKPINPNFIIDFENKVTHRDEYLVTNSSYRKTSNSSRSLVTKGSTYKESAAATNKYVSGDVKYHRIKQGDTLGAISRRYGTSVRTLCEMNNITSKTVLRVGKSIRIS